MSAYVTNLDDVPIVSPEPRVHCVVCNSAAPMVMRFAAWRNGKCLTPNTAGWMRSCFPWPAETSFIKALEWQWLCPKDAIEVAKFVAHRRVPMLGDEDLIG